MPSGLKNPIWIPVPYGARKVQASLTIGGEDVKANVMNLVWNDAVTTGVDYVQAELFNSGSYTDKWSGGESVKLYADYSDGTTRVFEGYLMSPEPSANGVPKVSIFAKGYGVEAQRVMVNRKFDAPADIGDIASILIGQYLPGHTVTNVNTSTGYYATPSWTNRSLWDCLRELATVHGKNLVDFRCDKDKGWHFFLRGSRTDLDASGNDKYPIFYAGNIIGNPATEAGISDRANKVTIYGNTVDGIQVFATSEDEAAQSASFVMEESYVNTNLTTYAQCKEEADAVLAAREVEGKTIEITTHGEINRIAGYSYFISHPYIPLTAYTPVTEIRHELRNGRFVDTNKIYQLAPNPIDPTERALTIISATLSRDKTADNQNGMKDTLSETFETGFSGTYANTQVLDGKLVLSSGSSGTWTSPAITLPYTATEAYLVINGANLDVSTFKVTAGGAPQELTPFALSAIVSPGSTIVLTVTLVSDATRLNPSLESVCLQLK